MILGRFNYLVGLLSLAAVHSAYPAYAASDKAPAELPYLLARAEMLVELERSEEAMTLLQGKVVYFENSAAIRDADRDGKTIGHDEEATGHPR